MKSTPTNKKIIGATPFKYNGIFFKSELEVRIYKTLIENGINPKYEEFTAVLWKGFKPTIPFYERVGKRAREITLNMKKLIDMTYTPDFTFELNGLFVVIEAKGYENDTFPIKKKLFRKFLEHYEKPSIFFEIYSKKDLLQALEIVKNVNL